MKFLFVFFLGLSAAVAIRLGYERGNRYTYRYKGVVVHGMPEAFDNDMGLTIGAIAHLDYLNDGFVVLKLEEIAIKTLKGKLLVADRMNKKLKEEKAQPEVTEHLKKCLKLAVKFQFRGKGLERTIIASKNDPTWCVNLKRGILNHLYLPIKNNQETYQTNYNEVSVSGKCRTAYTIVNKRPYYRVKRVFDLMHCHERPELWETNIPNLDEFIVKQTEVNQADRSRERLQSFIRSAAFMNYELQEITGKGFIIRQVVGESEHDFMMFGDAYQNGKAVVARTRQTLTFIAKEKPIPGLGTIPNAEKRGGLMFVYDNGETLTRTDEAQKKISDTVDAHVSALKDQLKVTPLRPEAAQEFARLISTLRRCTAKTLKSVVVDHIVNNKNVELKQLVLDAVSRVGTKDAGDVILEVVQEGKLNGYLERLMTGLGWTRFTNMKFLVNVFDVCQKQNVASRFNAKQACWLSFGNLMNNFMRICRTYPRIGYNTKVLALKHKIARLLKNFLTKAKDGEEKIIFLKTIGNAGWITSDTFDAVITVIKNPITQFHVKVQGIWALRHMARIQPLKVRQHLLPLFANPLRDAEIRIACFKILLRSDPSLLTCQMMANVISREAVGKGPRSNQVISFIASDLRTSVNLDIVDRVRASRARMLLRFLPRITSFGMLSFSKGINIAVDTGRKATLELRVHKVNARDTFIPRVLNVNVRLNSPGFSANVLQMGVRIQGIHDMLQAHVEPKNEDRRKRSLDILNFIFGIVSANATATNVDNEIKGKLTPRLAAYFKLFGSDLYYGKLVKKDLQKLIDEALFGEGTTTIAGITITKTGIKMNKRFTKAHMISETRYMIPTLLGIPLKISSKIAAAVKGHVELDVTVKPQLTALTTADNIQATVMVKPDVAIHMHNKVGVWLPMFETGITVKNQILTAPRLHQIITITKTNYRVELPVAKQVQHILNIRSKAIGLVRKEFTPGLRVWEVVDLEMTERGFRKIPPTCFGEQRFGVKACVEGTIPDMEYIRIKRLPAFPFLFLANLKVSLKNDDDRLTKIIGAYDITTNTPQTYVGTGKLDFTGTKERKITFKPECDKTKWTCNVGWTVKNELCTEVCKANTEIDYSTPNQIAIKHKYKEKFMNVLITIEKEGQVLRIVKTWNELPVLIQKILTKYHPEIIVYLHQYFGINGFVNKKNVKKAEIVVKLHDKFTADIFVQTPQLQLRRINQVLPFGLTKFPATKVDIKEMMKSRYGTCVVKETNDIKTTDNVVIRKEIPGHCPFVLAKDARTKEPKWQILLKLNEQGQQTVIVIVKNDKIELRPNLVVVVNGSPVPTQQQEVVVGGVRIRRQSKTKLSVQADVGFQFVFNGAEVALRFTSWWQNRIRGICGNSDREQWTDFGTRCNTFMPETMPREFIRDWMVPGKDFKDKQCKLQTKHMNHTRDARVCYTNGRFLQCVENCKPVATQNLRVAHHCVRKNSPDDERISQNIDIVDLPNMSVDLMAMITEHLTCACAK